MPPLVIAGVMMAGGAAVTAIGASNQAKAAERAGNATTAAARAETEAANQRLRMELAERRRIEERATAAAVRTPNEIAAINRVIRMRDEAYLQQKTQIDKQFAALDAVDPAIKEAGTQLLGLVRGESTKMLDPVMKNRSQQKSKLESQLRRTLGPGFRTTSAGIEALARFDDGTEQLLFNTQDAAINRAMSVYNTGMGARANAIGAAQNAYAGINALDQTVLSTESGIANRQTGAVIQGAASAPVNFGAIQEAKRGETAVAGAPFAGDMIRGQATSQIGGMVMGAASQIGMQQIGADMQEKMYGNLIKENAAAGGGGLSIGQIGFNVANTKPLTYNSPTFGQIGG